MRRQSTYWEQVEQELFEMRTFPMGILNNVIVAMYNLKKNFSVATSPFEFAQSSFLIQIRFSRFIFR